MTAPSGVGLARITVSTTGRRLDVAVPEDVPVAELLPEIVRHAGAGAADEGEQHGGWVLRTAAGTLLDPLHNLAGQGIRDGDVVHLVPGRAEWPELEYDDVVEAIASGARRYGRSWGAPATRRCALTVAAVLVLLPLLDVARSTPPWTLPARVALGLGVVLTLVGVVLARAGADALAGAVVAACGLPYAALGAALLATPRDVAITRLGTAQVLAGSVGLLLFAAIGYAGVGVLARLFAGALVAGLLGLLAGLLGETSLTSAGVAAVVLTVGIGLLPGYPLLSLRLGRLPLPSLPQRAEDMLADEPLPPRSEVYAAVARSDEILTGFLLGVSGVALVCSVVLVGTGGRAAPTLAAVAALTLLSRARLFPTPRQRLPLIVGGAGGLAYLAVAATWRAHSNGQLVAILAGTVLAAGVVLLAGLAYSRRPVSPYFGRFADIADVLLIISLVPVTCVIVGFYGYMRDLFASIGS